MSVLWSRNAVECLRRTTSCPRCDHVLTNYTFCATCGPDLGGEHALTVLTQSRSIADAIEARQLLSTVLPTHPEYTAAHARLAAPVGSAPQPVLVSVAPRPESDNVVSTGGLPSRVTVEVSSRPYQDARVIRRGPGERQCRS